MSITNLAVDVPQSSWVTAGGSLGTFFPGDSVNLNIEATNSDPKVMVYRVVSGSLPPGVSLNKYTGAIVGAVDSGFPATQTYNFTIKASVVGASPLTRDFSITFQNDPPVWQSPTAGSLGTFGAGDSINITFDADDPESQPVIYTLQSGTLPPGLTLNTSSGLLDGTVPSVISDTVYNFTIRASDGGLTTDRSFSIEYLNTPPDWVTPAGSLGSFNELTTVNETLVANDPDGLTITYTLDSGALPPGLSLSTGGVISGTIDGIDSTNETQSTMEFDVTNAQAPLADTFSIEVDFVSTGTINVSGSVDGNDLAATLNGATAFTNLGLTASWSSDVLTITDDHRANLSSPSLAQNTTNTIVEFDVTNTQASTATSFSLDVDASTISVTGISVANGTALANALNADGGFSGAGLTASWSSDVLTITDDAQATFANPSLQDGTASEIDSTPTITAGAVGGEIDSSPTFTQGLTGTIDYNFTVAASDPQSNTTLRSFSITVNDVNDEPVWDTPGGSLGSFDEDVAISTITLVANDTEDGVVSDYTVIAGSLPPGLSLNSTNGQITGTPSLVASDTTFNFTVAATDSDGQSSDRNFSIEIVSTNDAPVWTTASGNIATIFDGDPVPGGTQVVATGPEPSDTVTYTLAPGSNPLPSGVTLNSNGTFTGTVTEDVADTTVFNFTVRAQDQLSQFTDRNFSITVEDDDPPTWSTSSPLADIQVGQLPTTLVATDPDAGGPLTYTTVSGTVPSGASLQSDGTWSGTTDFPDDYNFTARAEDVAGNTTDRIFDINVWDHVLIASFDGTNGQNTGFVDDAGYFNNGSATLSNGAGNWGLLTSQSQFGSSSLGAEELTGSSITIVDTSFGSINTDVIDLQGDWTLEFWKYSTTVGRSDYELRFELGFPIGGTTSGWRFTELLTGDVRLIKYGTASTNSQSFTSPSGGYSASTWQHNAIVVQNNIARRYIGGTQIGGTLNMTAGGNPSAPSTGEFEIRLFARNGNSLYIDEVRLTKGHAVYTSNFTPPTAPF